jgi:energy-coupling factor transporter ATP-binding protein EcfA2
MIVGPSDSGKSSFLRLLKRLDESTEGGGLYGRPGLPGDATEKTQAPGGHGAAICIDHVWPSLEMIHASGD